MREDWQSDSASDMAFTTHFGRNDVLYGRMFVPTDRLHMDIKYAFWNNKGGTGKTSLAFQAITRYAERNRTRNCGQDRAACDG